MFNFGLSEEQALLQTTVRKFMTERCPTTFVREMMEDPVGYSPAMWKEMADLGWLGVNVPEEYGGSDMGFVFMTVVMEQMGAALLPAPFLETEMVTDGRPRESPGLEVAQSSPIR